MHWKTTLRGRYRVPHVLTVESRDGRRLVLCESHFDSRRMPHREPEEGPAIIETFLSGKLERVQYRWHGLFHREDGPASIIYDGMDRVTFEGWYRFGRGHRDPRQGPADRFYSGGKLSEEIYRVHEYAYRDPREGPYRIEYNEAGEVTKREYRAELPPRPQPSLKWLRAVYGPTPHS
jgi:hypothetical protein